MNNKRVSKYPIEKNILNRWSPRSMTGESISYQTLLSIFEAGRWAPSSYNNQPWRFIFAMRKTLQWKKLFDLLVEFNQSWAKNASVLCVVISKKTFEFNNKNSRTHHFDTGAAWENIAIEATSKGYVAHAMEGFDYEKTKHTLKIPSDYEVLCMFAIGVQGEKTNLPDSLQEQEFPSERKPLSEILMEGEFGNNIVES